MNRNHPQAQQINVVLHKKQVAWIDKQAKDLRLDRTKVIEMLIDGLMRTEQAASKNETLFNVYSNHIEYVLEESMKKKKKTKKK